MATRAGSQRASPGKLIPHICSALALDQTALRVERLDTEAGKSLTISEVLAVSDGKTLTVGTPTVKGAKVKSTVVEHIRGEKVISFKKKRRKGYARTKGHRQELTVLKVDSIA